MRMLVNGPISGAGCFWFYKFYRSFEKLRFPAPPWRCPKSLRRSRACQYSA